MAQIVPKLNLNKTPTKVESNSLVFAKNIRLDVDGSIHRDYGVFPMSIHEGNKTDKLVNYKNILNRIISDVEQDINKSANPDKYLYVVLDGLKRISGKNITNIGGIVIAKDGTYKIVGTISNSNEFYMFINGTCVTGKDANNNDIIQTHNFIICYDEKEDRFHPCNCNWSWSGGTINGCVINNLLGEKILNIAESNAINLVPFKCINLNVSNIKDDERIYTQTPNIPITNLSYIGSFNYVIPNGVYQFFIRYKIRDNFYTDWFPASKEIFAGNKNITNTSFGTVKFVNTHRDSDTSFKFSVEHLFPNQEYNYKSFQIGFILSHDDAIVARAWKHFDFNIDTITFDYNSKDALEIEVIDLIKNAYQLYDVGNVTSFKNKLYISNYKETDFNEDHQNLANQVGIEICDQTAVSGYDGYTIIEQNINGDSVIAGLVIENENVLFSGEHGIIHQLLNIKNNNNDESVKDAIYDAIGENKKGNTKCGAKKWSISVEGDKTSLETAQNVFERKHSGKYSSNFNYSSNIYKIKVGDTYIDPEENILNNILSTIYTKFRYLDNNCIFVNSAGIADYQIDIIITRPCSYITKKWVSGGAQGGYEDFDKIDDKPITKTAKEQSTPDIINEGHYEETLVNDYYDQIISIKLKGDRTKYNITEGSFLTSYTTLIPYQKYKFYIHYVKQNGEISNGYYCNGEQGGIKTCPFKNKVNSVIYPKFTNINLPKDYVACFFSIIHIENKVSTVFNIDTTGMYGEASCIDINAGLVAGSDKLTIKQGYKDVIGDGLIIDPNQPDINIDIPIVKPIVSKASVNVPTTTKEIRTDSAKYYYSSDTSNNRYFGADGIIQFNKESGITDGSDDGKSGSNVAYLVNEYSISETEDIQLIKCTPFINPFTLSIENDVNFYDSFNDMNLLGFICGINPLNRTRTIDYYTDGSSVFYKPNSADSDDAGIYFRLVELKNHLLDTTVEKEKLTSLNILSTNVVYVYSNYNLNYLALTEDPVETYKSYYNNASEDTTDKTTSTGTMVLRLFKSLTMQSVYELPAMYKNYTKKTYSIYKTDEIVEFNNTIRASRLEEDESHINIFKFDANDYYNVPTNRGLIVNLISVGDAILAHTEDSMFKFSGSNTLQSSDGEIQPTENNVFDTGVTEVFGSDFGFAGLQYKTDAIITESGYIFFDRDAGIVYMYSGQGQIVRISESIEKLFRYKEIETIRFANDFYNNRFFMSIVFYENDIMFDGLVPGGIPVKKRYPVTLSFNITNEIKSFVSLHDFYYNYAFNTKTKCYFLSKDNQDICSISKKYKGCYTKLDLYNDKTYLQRKELTKINVVDSDEANEVEIEYEMNIFDSITDIIINNNYESIKTLNAISWCGTKVNSEFIDVNKDNEVTLNMVEEVNNQNPCDYIRIYTDTCMTNLLPCTSSSNDKSITALDYTKYPFYNQGIWQFNYFRNILNSKNNKIRYSGDNNSLIEGKYIVVRFIYNSDFKLETLHLNYNIK